MFTPVNILSEMSSCLSLQVFAFSQILSFDSVEELHIFDENVFECVLGRVSKEEQCFMRRFREYPLIQDWLMNSTNIHTDDHTHTNTHSSLVCPFHSFTVMHCEFRAYDGRLLRGSRGFNEALWRLRADCFTVPGRRRSPLRKVWGGGESFSHNPLHNTVNLCQEKQISNCINWRWTSTQNSDISVAELRHHYKCACSHAKSEDAMFTGSDVL